MYGELKKIMRRSFHDKFFIDRTNTVANNEYLDALVGVVIDKCSNMEDYEEIGNKMCIIDNRIQNMFALNYEILPSVFCNIHVEESWANDINNTLSTDIITRLLRNTYSELEYRHNYIVSLLFENWSDLGKTLQILFLNSVRECIVKYIDLDEIKIVYRVKMLSHNNIESLAINEIIKWYMKKMGGLFSHQSIEAVTLLKPYEIKEMYYSINRELVTTEFNGFVDVDTGKIIDCIIREKMPCFNIKKEFELFLEDLSNEDKQILFTIAFLQDKICDLLYEREQSRLVLVKEKKLYTDNAVILKQENEKLKKLNDELQYQVQINKQKMNKERESLFEEMNVMKKELVSLRNYMFINQTSEDNMECLDVPYMGTYEKVVIVGGHIKWQQKISSSLPGVQMIHTDQNTVDFSFLQNIDLVVIVTNSISHSMYYRLMEHLNRQELLFVSFRNMDKLKSEIDNKLTKKR